MFLLRLTLKFEMLIVTGHKSLSNSLLADRPAAHCPLLRGKAVDVHFCLLIISSFLLDLLNQC